MQNSYWCRSKIIHFEEFLSEILMLFSIYGRFVFYFTVALIGFNHLSEFIDSKKRPRNRKPKHWNFEIPEIDKKRTKISKNLRMQIRQWCDMKILCWDDRSWLWLPPHNFTVWFCFWRQNFWTVQNIHRLDFNITYTDPWLFMFFVSYLRALKFLLSFIFNVEVNTKIFSVNIIAEIWERWGELLTRRKWNWI